MFNKNYTPPTFDPFQKMFYPGGGTPITKDNPKDKQIGGTHYKEMAIQPSEYIVKNGLGWYEGNAIKYLTRHKAKGQKADLEKAIHYIELAIQHYYGEK